MGQIDSSYASELSVVLRDGWMKCDPALHVVHVRVSVIRSSAVVTLQFMPDMFLRQLVVSLDRNRQVIFAGFLPISVCVYNLRMVCKYWEIKSW